MYCILVDKYLILTKCEVHTIIYGPKFYWLVNNSNVTKFSSAESQYQQYKVHCTSLKIVKCYVQKSFI